MKGISQQIEDMLVQIGKQTEGRDLSPILPVLASRYRDSIITNVMEHGRWDGDENDIGLFSGGSQKWDNLAISTKRAYKRQGITDLGRTLDRTGALRAAVEVTPVDNSIDFTANKDYARIQQEGGETKPVIPITPKMRKFFWAMFFETGNEMYKGLALTKKTELRPTIIIPASPYIVIQEADFEFTQDVIGDFISEQ